MDTDRLIDALEQSGEIVATALAGLTPEGAAWRPSAGGWSVLEIAGHLLDEERLDFRPRIESTLRDPKAEWVAIDPESWVEAHGYAQRDLVAVRAEWIEERRASVAWLRGLGDVDWTKSHTRGTIGTIAAGDLLAAWVAHDPLHLRQIARRMYERATSDALPFTPRYAGPWS